MPSSIQLSKSLEVDLKYLYFSQMHFKGMCNLCILGWSKRNAVLELKEVIFPFYSVVDRTPPGVLCSLQCSQEQQGQWHLLLDQLLKAPSTRVLNIVSLGNQPQVTTTFILKYFLPHIQYKWITTVAFCTVHTGFDKRYLCLYHKPNL